MLVGEIIMAMCLVRIAALYVQYYMTYSTYNQVQPRLAKEATWEAEFGNFQGEECYCMLLVVSG